MSNFESIPNSFDPNENLLQENKELPPTQVNYRDKTFEKTQSGWIDVNNKEGHIVPFDMPFAQELERLLQVQHGEKIGEISHRDMIFERYSSGWLNKKLPDFVILIDTPFGQELENLFKSQQ